MQLTSPAFEDGASIPDQYGYTERNVNPPLSIHGVPDDAESLAIVVDDPDARKPAGKIWDHWVLWNVPAERTTIAEDYDAAADGAREGRNDFGETGYGGPNPPDREHTYRFQVAALGAELGLSAGATKAGLEEAMTGHVQERALLEGTYAP